MVSRVRLLWAGATLPNESGSVHLGSPTDICFALLRASRLAFGAAFLSRGKRFRRGRGHSIQASRTTFAALPLHPASQQGAVPKFVAVRPFDERDLTDQHRLYAPPGFTGSAPGGPSRWNQGEGNTWQPLQPQLVIEV
jgi:hypothetical protein